VGRHSKPSKAKTALKRTGAIAALAGTTVGGIAIFGSGTANAFPGQAGLVVCESGGNPTIVNNTPAGQQAGRPAGLFQIVTQTWLANGGGQFAPTADQASPSQQQVVADRIFAQQGSAPWECHTGAGPTPFSNFGQASPDAAPVAAMTAGPSRQSDPPPTPAPAAADEPSSNPTGDYTVVSGDTLSGIAQKFNVPGGWAHLQQMNSQYIPNANLILAGQKIATK